MKKYVLLLVVAVLATAFATVPFGAFGGDGKRFVVSFRSTFTGPNSDAGTFSMAGALNDGGTVSDTFTVTPGKHDEATLDGTQTLAGSLGTITTHFTGTIFPASSTRAISEGTAVITGGTGAYAGLDGKAAFLGVVDFAAGTVTLTEDWKKK